MVQQTDFFGYEKYTIASAELQVSVITLGATVTSIQFAGRETVLAHQTAQHYFEAEGYVGAIIGRYANRIREATAEIDGKPCHLTPNEGRHHLHGGPDAFDRRRWDAEVLSESAVKFTLFSPHGDNGYPGNLTAAVTYTVTGSSLRIDFEGDCDAPTLYAPTTHIYFNLGSTASILETQLRINADAVVETDGELLPTGRLLPCEGVYDFRRLRPIRQSYDHCFLLNSPQACVAAYGDIGMALETDYPGLQLYTGECLNMDLKSGSGFAVEPAFPPDSPNCATFPSPLLMPGQHYRKYIHYRFVQNK